jgi:cyclic beta-1,2-glucan synthetase
VVTLVRLGVTHRRLLEWETMAASAARGGAPRPSGFLRGMLAGPIIAIVAAAATMAVRPAALPVAAPVLLLWLVAPWIAFALSRPLATRRPAMAGTDRDYLTAVARQTWRYFETFVGAEDHYLPPDNVQVEPEVMVAHRTSPTNIGLGLLSTLTAHDLGFIDEGALITQVGLTLDTVERLERHEGHLLNWYDTRTLRPLLPAYVSTVDSGNLAGALVALAVGLRGRAPDLADRAMALFNGMNFRFLFDADRQLFSIGYRVADAEVPGRLDASFYDLLASEARLASFLAIAKGDVPEKHWFHLGRSITAVRGRPVLLSWSATLFEYLMPLLVMRSYPNTLLDESCRLVVRRQIATTPTRSACPGASRSRPTTWSTATATTSTRRSASPGSGSSAGSATRWWWRPMPPRWPCWSIPAPPSPTCDDWPTRASPATYGFFDAIDYTRRGPDAAAADAPTAGVVVSSYMAHHQGMTLVAIANALLDNRMVERFHAEPHVQATEMLLQERLPRDVATIEPRPRDEMREATPVVTMPVRASAPRRRSIRTPSSSRTAATSPR